MPPKRFGHAGAAKPLSKRQAAKRRAAASRSPRGALPGWFAVRNPRSRRRNDSRSSSSICTDSELEADVGAPLAPGVVGDRRDEIGSLAEGKRAPLQRI